MRTIIDRLEAHLQATYGPRPELTALTHFLIPTRSPFYNVDIRVAIEDGGSRGNEHLVYTIGFEARLDKLIFAVCDEESTSESLLAGFREIVEVTTAAPGESLEALVDKLVNGGMRLSRNRVSIHGTSALERILLRTATSDETAALASTPVEVPDHKYRLIVSADLDGSRFDRYRLVIRRPWNEHWRNIPWWADRPIYIRQFEIDVSEVQGQWLECGVTIFHIANESTHLDSRSNTLRQIVRPDGWFYVGQGFMMHFGPRVQNANREVSVVM